MYTLQHRGSKTDTHSLAGTGLEETLHVLQDTVLLATELLKSSAMQTAKHNTPCVIAGICSTDSS